MTPFERVLANALIIAGITFFSTMTIDFPPTAQNVWAAGVAAVLALLTQLKQITEEQTEESGKDRKPPNLGMLI